MNRCRVQIFSNVLVVAIAILIGALPADAAGNGICPSKTSIFGTVDSVRGSTIYIKRSGFYGYSSISDAGAAIHTNRLTLRSGVFVGAYGCYSPGERVFHATEVTLAASEAAYPDRGRRTEEISGKVTDVASGRIQIETGPAHGLTTINTSYPAKVGDIVSAVGYFNTDGTFNASSVKVVSGGITTPSKVAVTGGVDEIHPDGFSLSTHGPIGHIRIYMADAKLYGPEPKLGSHVCVYGMFTNQQRAVKAIAVITAEGTS